MAKYILSIDQGTTSSRAILFDENGLLITQAQEEFTQHFPQDGWVEHNPDDLWGTVINTCRQVINDSNISVGDICAIGITNQRETTLIWDKLTGKPIYNAIVWQDRRTAEYCQLLSCEQTEQLINEKTGLLLDSYFSASKISWLLEHVAGARQRAEQGKLLFGTVDSFIIWHLTGGKKHHTDATNASRTLLFNIHQQCWDQELLKLFNVPEKMLPKVLDSSAEFGHSEPQLLGKSIPILGVAGDQQAALFGQACFKPGMAKCTYGTGAFLMLNTGKQALKSKNRLLTTIGYRLNGEVSYAIEGSIFSAGATMQWLRDGLKLFQHASETQKMAESTAIDHGVFLIPAFTGLGAPYWQPNARGALFGLTRDSGANEIVTAALQSVCYQSKDLQKAMENDGVRPSVLRVDGGMVANDWLLGFLADMLAAKVERPEILETTALGVAYLAGLKAGVFKSLTQIESLWTCQNRFLAKMNKKQRDQLYEQWLTAVARVVK